MASDAHTARTKGIVFGQGKPPSSPPKKKKPTLADQAKGQHQPPKPGIPKFREGQHPSARPVGIADLAEAQQVIAEQVDMPSVYMGGPSQRARRAANDALDALTARGFLLYRVDIPKVEDD